ncbi:flagellar hook-length control protein FliK [Dyella acidisoli]|uniref:Flagellar hook-length control protein-like C-terminal domain-containing protein n=1 Tax=Dyella acidisoli TaxID=1867834 RepID=A0ABQ5XTJ5_9GAMM|nr:flagellar hook-length control protein FliK [Dyella acidisoli]GLQ93748.1 hypothetical protein GCM10007901_26990 [Dyella acidisoli]
MSATPLPSLPITPSTSTQHAGAPRWESQQHSGASFTSHLQSAQRQSSDSTQTPKQNSDAEQNDNTRQTSTAQADNPSSNTDKPGDANASKQDDATNTSDSGIDLTGGVGTLASVVLSLIDHAAGDTPGGTAASTHAAPAKPVAQPGNKPIAAAQPDALATALIPTPLAAAMGISPTTTTSANGSLQMSDGIGALSQKASAFASANADNAVASDTNNASATADGGASTPSGGDNLQTFAAGLAAIGHASVPAAASAATDNGSQNSPDLAALGSITAAASAASTGATTGATHNLAMNAPVGTSGFAKELGQQITWLSGQDVKQAQIRLNPQNLGPLDVKVSVEHGRVDVSFMTQHAATTTAVQQGLDQLNQMLSGQGLSLGHATVGQHAQQQFGGQQGQQAQASGTANDDVVDTPVATAARVAVGLVDAFA